MTKLFKLVAATIGLSLISSCSDRGPKDLEGLKQIVTEAIEENQPNLISEVLYLEGADPEVKEAMEKLLSSLDFSKLPGLTVEVYEFANYEPESPQPGVIRGRELEWLVEPTHWIVAKEASENEGSSQRAFAMTFAAVEIDGKWWLVGSTYTEEADAEASGLDQTEEVETSSPVDDEGKVEESN